MYLLDTSALIDLLEENPSVVAHFAEVAGELAYASVISEGEAGIGILRLGTRHPREAESYAVRVARVLDRLTLLPAPSTTASAYASLQAGLLSRGRPRLRINDGWIAATALEHNLTLVTSDAHLKALAGLVPVVDWRE